MMTTDANNARMDWSPQGDAAQRISRVGLELVRGTETQILDLWRLLSERTPEQSISHKAMPSFHDHTWFVRRHPYLVWYMVRVNDAIVGSIYLTHQREIGVFIFQQHQRRGYARAAVRMLTHYHPGKFLANVNPANEASIRFWEKLGFRHIQNTYARD